MRNADGVPVLMDINPRLTATVSVIAAGGVNLPYLRIKQLLGEDLPECHVVYGTRLKRRYLEHFTTPEGNLIPLINRDSCCIIILNVYSILSVPFYCY